MKLPKNVTLRMIMIIWSKNMTFGKCIVEKINDCRIRFSFNFRGCTFCEMGMAWDQSSCNNHEVGFWENCTKYLNSRGMTIFEQLWRNPIQLETKEIYKKFLAFLALQRSKFHLKTEVIFKMAKKPPKLLLFVLHKSPPIMVKTT